MVLKCGGIFVINMIGDMVNANPAPEPNWDRRIARSLDPMRSKRTSCLKWRSTLNAASCCHPPRAMSGSISSGSNVLGRIPSQILPRRGGQNQLCRPMTSRMLPLHPEMCTFGILGLSCEAPELQTCTFEVPAFQNTTNIPREDPKRGKKERKLWLERAKKRQNWGSPYFGPQSEEPHMKGPILRGPPFGTLPIQGPDPKCGVDQTWFGQSWCWSNLVWPKLVLATDGLAKLGKTRWPNFVWPKLATPSEAPSSRILVLGGPGFGCFSDLASAIHTWNIPSPPLGISLSATSNWTGHRNILRKIGQHCCALCDLTAATCNNANIPLFQSVPHLAFAATQPMFHVLDISTGQRRIVQRRWTISHPHWG